MEWIKITAETPLEEVQRMHKQIWDYVLEHGKKPEDCPYNACCAACEYDGMCNDSCTTCPYDCPYDEDCAACEYDGMCNDSCTTCPIKWPKEKCYGNNSLYRKWLKTRSPDIARQIRDVEFKTKEEILK